MKKELNKGISLVALIISIIILIIITAAIILTFMDGGILERAKESTFKSDIDTYKIQLQKSIADKKLEFKIYSGKEVIATFEGVGEADIREWIDLIDEERFNGKLIIHEGVLKYIVEGVTELEAQWLEEINVPPYNLETEDDSNEEGVGGEIEGTIADMVKVKDVVEYRPYEGNTFVPMTYTIDDTSWCYNNRNYNNSYDSDNAENKIERYEDYAWRVIKNDGTYVTLIGIELNSKYNIALKGKKGYLQGQDKLDEICEVLYSSDKTIEVRSITIEDILEIIDYDAEDETKWMYYDTLNWGNHDAYIPKGVKTIGDLENKLEINLVNRDTPDGKDISTYIPDCYMFEVYDYTKWEEYGESGGLRFLVNDAVNGGWIPSKTVKITSGGYSSFSGENIPGYAEFGFHSSSSIIEVLYNNKDGDKQVSRHLVPIAVLRSDLKVKGAPLYEGSSCYSWEIIE